LAALPLKIKIEKIQKSIADNLSGKMVNGVTLKQPSIMEMSIQDDELNGGSSSFRSISKLSPRSSIVVINHNNKSPRNLNTSMNNNSMIK
jgi:hypothetical protein